MLYIEILCCSILCSSSLQDNKGHYVSNMNFVTDSDVSVKYFEWFSNFHIRINSKIDNRELRQAQTQKHKQTICQYNT